MIEDCEMTALIFMEREQSIDKKLTFIEKNL